MRTLATKVARLSGSGDGSRQSEVYVVLNGNACGVSGFVDGSLPVLSSVPPQALHLTTVVVEVIVPQYFSDCESGRARSHDVRVRQKHSWERRR